MGLSTSLDGGPPWLLNSYAIGAAFTAYFCMYAFRKPFVAGTFEGTSPLSSEVTLKTSFVMVQIIGYALSKYLGARLLPELRAAWRGRAILGLVGVSWLALLVFAMVPPAFALVAMFVNGLCLGMIWGLVVSFLEGRRSSEFLLAGLSCSFIVASGVVKDVGRALMRAGISETWMPFVTGALFVPGLVVSVYLLTRLPGPTSVDVKERSLRSVMTKEDRRAFLRKHGGPLALLLVVYFFLTAYRDYRDNYGVELFSELGFKAQPALFSSTEIPVALGVLLALSLLALVRNNQRALGYAFGIMIFGLLLISGATYLLKAEIIGGVPWMILTGLGSYLAYVPFGSVLFDRIMAQTRAVGTAVFGIYLADAIGYTGSICVQIYGDVFSGELSRLEFFFGLTHMMAWGGAALLLLSARGFSRKNHFKE